MLKEILPPLSQVFPFLCASLMCSNCLCVKHFVVYISFIFPSSSGFSTPQSKPLQGFPFAHQLPDPSAFLPLSYHGYQPSPFSSAASSSSLDASLAVKAGASLLESSALWDMTYGTRPVRLGADLSSGSSGYQSGTSHTGRTTRNDNNQYIICRISQIQK